MNRRQFIKTGAATGAVLAVGGGGAENRAANQATKMYGVDVSNWQGTINWNSVRNAKKQFAFMKATEGGTFVDPKFTANWTACKAAGIIRGAYHFARPGSATSATGQADFFVNTVKPIPGDLQLCLDIETTDGVTQTALRSFITTFCARILSRTGRPGIIYTSPSFWTSTVGNLSNQNCPLWIANWNVASPTVPTAWSTWTFWQTSATGVVPGISGDVDLNTFNGKPDRLHQLMLPG